MKKSWLIFIVVSIVVVIALLIGSRSANNEVLETFTIMNEKIEDANEETIRRNNAMLQEVLDNAKSQSVDVSLLDRASDQLDTYLIDLKRDMLSGLDPNDFEKMDKSSYLDSLFFDGDTVSEKGNEFLSYIEHYRSTLSENFKDDYPEIISAMETNFSTAPVELHNGSQQNWLPYHFKNFPLVASLTKMTQMQNDINTIKNELMDAIISSEE